MVKTTLSCTVSEIAYYSGYWLVLVGVLYRRQRRHDRRLWQRRFAKRLFSQCGSVLPKM